jgi:hypothetical protein
MPSRRSRLRILPKELRTSDRFTDVHDVSWEIVTHPQARLGGKNFEACVQRPGQQATARVMVWAADERVTIRRWR